MEIPWTAKPIRLCGRKKERDNNMKISTGIVLMMLFTLPIQSLAEEVAKTDKSEKPNFLIIVADDMGWSDISPFGSEIRTPTLQQLAEEGLAMSQFYVAPTCAPTRAMLMTGLDNHRAGVGAQMKNQAPNQLEYEHYKGQLLPEVVTIPEGLARAGYQSVMAGKWHLDIDEEQLPNHRGFDRSFVLLEGGAGHFSDLQPVNPGNTVTYLEDGQPVALPDDFYSTTHYTAKLIEYIDEIEDETPFFAYLAYTAPHDPLQVPDEWYDRYQGAYDEGPEAVRARRVERLLELGWLDQQPELWNPPEFPAWLPLYKGPWAERSPSARAVDTRRMEIYASMIELMDSEIGRLLSHLQETDRLDNTYVLFFADNGANALTPLFYPNYTREHLFEVLDNSYENMGKRNSHTSQGAEWAVMSSTPSKLYKGLTAEGGVRSPFIVKGPDISQGARSAEIGHITDIAPTLYELAGVDLQSQPFKHGLRPEGMSIAAAWEGEQLPERTIITELFGLRMVRQGQWKATFIIAPFGNDDWQLYDLKRDPAELHDLAERYPERLLEMTDAYDAWAIDQNVIPPEGNRDGREFSISWFHDEPCDWWCETRFAVVDLLAQLTASD